MANDWQKILDNFSGSNKAATPTVTSSPSTSGASSSTKKKKDDWQSILDEFSGSKKSTSSVSSRVSDRVQTTKEKKKEEEKKERKWFQKGLFEDGWQFGDLTKTILGSATDLLEDAGAGIIGLGEKAVDTFATIAPYAYQSQYYQNGGGFNAEQDKLVNSITAEAKKETAKFVAKDLYDEEAVARKLISAPVKKLTGIDTEQASVFGEKSDALMQSAGQLAATVGLQAVGVPWFVTSGVAGYGSEVENALNEGASNEEAMLSGVISAGAEILTEKLSGGIKFGGKALDDVITKQIARGVSNKTVRTLAKLGLDMTGEGAEEVLSGVMSAVGQKISYADDAELSELFSTEEAWESFIGGAALGGVAGGVNAIKSNSKGVDYVSELTQNEQKVVDKLYNDRIAEAEKDGKISSREKSKIYDEVLRDMEKGYISTDTIEEVLDGEGYSAYNELVKEAEEYNTLYKTESGKLSEEQRDRLAELKEKNKTNPYEAQIQTARDSLSESVFGLVQSDRLSESYNERSRRGQAFEADLSRYSAKQQEVIKRAAESGILNNTNRTHEFVDMVAKISADKGVLFDFTNNEKLKNSGFAVEGKTVNGFVTKDGVTLNIDSTKALDTVTGHEITHVLEGTELYTELQNVIFEYAKTKGEYDSRRKDLEALYKDIKDADIDGELTADLVGDYLFSDTDFVNKLSTEHRNVFQKIYDEIKYLCKVATAGSKEARELERVKRAFDNAYKAGGKAKSGTKYSVSDSTGKELTKEQQDYFKDSKVRDDDGNLKVMYHGTQDAGFHTFNSDFSDDGTSFFFVDRNEAAATYSGTTETYAPVGFRTVEDANKFFADVGNADVIEKLNEQADSLKKNLDSQYGALLNDLAAYFATNHYDTPEAAAKSILTNKKFAELSIDAGMLGELAQRVNTYYELKAEESKTRREAQLADNGVRKYKVVEENGKYKLLDDGDEVATSDSLDTIYEEFRDWSGLGYGDANYEVYLNLTNPLEVDANGRNWNNVSREFSQEVYDRYLSLTEAERAALTDIAEWGEYSIFRDELLSVAKAASDGKLDDASVNLASAYEKLGGANANLYDAFTIASDNFSEDALREFAVKQMNTRDYAQKAKEQGYDGVIFKNIVDLGGYSNGSEGAATVAIAFDSKQIKSVANEKPTDDADIRYSLSADSEGRELTEAQKAYFHGSKVTDENGNLKVVYHGSPVEFNTFSLDYLGTNGTAEGYGFYFTDKKRIAEGYSRGYEGQQGNEKPGKLFECYLDIKKPLSDKEVTMTRAQFKKFLTTLNKQVDADGEPLDILSNYGDVSWEGLNNVLNYAMEIEYDGSDNDVNLVHSIINGCGNMKVCFDVLRKTTGYDGIIVDEATWGGDQTIYIAFHPEQIKNVDNLEPTPNPDTRYSLSNNGEQPSGKYLGRDIALAPVAETVAENTTVAPETTTQELFPDDLAPYEDDAERFESLDDADAPPEIDAPYHDEQADLIPLTKKTVADIAKSVRSELGLNNRQVSEVRGIIQKYAETEFPSRDELYSEIEESFGTIPYEETVEDIKAVKDFLRSYKISVSPEIKSNIADYAQVMRSNFGKVRFSKDGVSVDTAYQELSGMYPGSFPDDIINPADQLIQILDVANESHTAERLYEVDSETLEKVTDSIIKGVNEYKQSQKLKDAERVDKAAFKALTDDYAPVAEENTATQDIAPVKPVKRKPVKDEVAATKEAPKDSKTAKIMREVNKLPREGRNMGLKAVTNFVDKGMVFENLSHETGNMELQAKYDYALPSKSEARAQEFMKNGTKGVKSLDAIRKEVGKNEQQFQNYLYHLHNIDRMTLDERFGVENKAVYGDSVTADVSREEVKQYEAAHPEFKRFANDVYKFNNHLRKLLVDNGVISQETADLWQKMYPHYVPIHRVDVDGVNISVPLDTRKTGVNNPVKRATGGNSDIQPLFNTMAERTMQTYKAIARNSFGVELKNTLGSTITQDKAALDEVIDSIGTQDELLKEGKLGLNPTFTVFENGERVEFEITEDMYDALKPTSPGLAYTNKPLNKISEFRRNTLTSWNPVFALYRNPVKDIQDIVINSQHPAKTYMNIPKAVFDLAKGGKYATEYYEHGGRQNTYYDKENNSFDVKDSILKKITGIGALENAGNFIETVPRLAEFIASRNEGRSIERSMLDAARVTTNFAAGGDYTKFANRHGVTFLNASVQGASQHVRNIREAKINGLKGWLQLAAKYAIAGLPEILLNNLLWKDDEEYDELSEYVKDSYYVIAKTEDGKFIRVPKGRTAAVIQEGIEQISNAATGDNEADFEKFFKLFMDNIAPNNPLDNNILAPIGQTLQNKTWYGEDLVPSRLAKLPAKEQFDESTDAISKWLGEKTGISPVKLNYLIDQYSGGFGDTFLPMLTPEAESGDDSFIGNVLAPWKKEMSTDSVLNNRYPGEFYDLRDKLEVKSNARDATEEDKLKTLYLDEVGWEMSDLYAEKREIQNSDLSDSEKYKAIREVQAEINALAENALNGYNNVLHEGYYAEVGDKRFDFNAENGKWYEVTPKNYDGSDNWYYIQEQLSHDKLGISYSDFWNGKKAPDDLTGKSFYGELNGKRYNYDAEKSQWYEIREKNEDGSDNWYYQKEQEVTKGLGISYEEYWSKPKEYNFAHDKPGEYAIAQAIGGYDSLMEHYEYLEYGYNPDKYLAADKDAKGESISGSRKKKVMDYIDGLDLDYGEKIILYRSQYSSKADKRAYNMEIVDYLNSRNDIDYNQMKNILEQLDMTVDERGYITW